ncbi:helix-turn-helix transcriptional regulator [Cohnella pontilimi]|uniref:helix-turn-helix transcriptional regulator n=1 Tax=Cohnella pontilimi TaxID=2564100 RepID=UPI00319E53B5
MGEGSENVTPTSRFITKRLLYGLKGEFRIELTRRQSEIIDLVKRHAPVTGEQIAEHLGLSRPTIRSDLSVLIMLGHLDAKPKVGYFLGKEQSSVGRLKDKLTNLKVQDLMSRPFVISEQATVNDAVISLFTENTGMLSVTDAQGCLSGMVSAKDLLKVALGNPAAASIPISMVMTRLPRIITVLPEDTLWKAASKMLENQIGGLPVVRPLESPEMKGKLEVIGRITKTNIMQFLVELSSDT